jgi:tRNA1(Val) A37 N6-methylase TrmN6
MSMKPISLVQVGDQTSPWYSSSFLPPILSAELADASLRADDFLGEVSQGKAFLWTGDFQSAKQLLQAVKRRISDKWDRREKKLSHQSPLDIFHAHRQHQSQRARDLHRLLMRVERSGEIKNPRAPNLMDPISQLISLPQTTQFTLSLQDILGLVGAFEWRRNGVVVEALGGEKIFPDYGVFFPVRQDYLELLRKVPLRPRWQTAMDVGVGSGVVTALLLSRGLQKVIGTDLNESALECAKKNLDRMGLLGAVNLIKCNLFSHQKVDLLVCNPPWIPGRPTSLLELGIFDENSAMTRQFLHQAAQHVSPEGEVWLVNSSFPESLGLRKSGAIEEWGKEGGLEVIELHEISPEHPKSQSSQGLLARLRAQEKVQLWRFRPN